MVREGWGRGGAVGASWGAGALAEASGGSVGAGAGSSGSASGSRASDTGGADSSNAGICSAREAAGGGSGAASRAVGVTASLHGLAAGRAEQLLAARSAAVAYAEDSEDPRLAAVLIAAAAEMCDALGESDDIDESPRASVSVRVPCS